VPGGGLQKRKHYQRTQSLRPTTMPNVKEAGLSDLLDAGVLQSLCREVCFEPGAVLRQRGRHYRDMYLLTHGGVDVELGPGGGTRPVMAGPGAPIGEIGFLRGSPATATVTARAATAALVIDDATMARLEREQSAVTAQLLRRLAEIAEERMSYNLVQTAPTGVYRRRRAVETLLCRDAGMLERAQRLRYEVYCGELGRQSPFADHDRGIIIDPLDATGNTFIAVEDRETIGTLRSNAPADGPLGVFEELYGMRKSPHHPGATCICTKFIVRKSNRGGPAAMNLIAAMVRYGLQNGIRECYIDCIPALLPYYKAIGFSISGEQFLHRENGPSHPMALDVAKHGKMLSSESGVRVRLTLLVKAKAIKWIDKVRQPARLVAPA
jgi:CRP-like cAMP-binding protein